MNPKSRLWIIHDKTTILMNTTFAKMEKNTFSAEYAHLQRIKQENPGYTVAVREINKKPNKNAYKGMTYENMRKYIIRYTDGERRTKLLQEFDHMLDIAHLQAQAIRYPTMKKWFLAHFPEVKNFALADDESANAEETINAGDCDEC